MLRLDFTQLSEKMQPMVEFRNMSVYEWTALDTETLKAILTNKLTDLEEFYTQILKHFKLVA